jgi:hypothetical protein
MKEGKVWIGRASVIPLAGNDDLGDATGATVNVLHWAVNQGNFVLEVRQQLLEYGFELTRLEDCDEFNFDNEVAYKDQLLERAQHVYKYRELQWGTFYTYPKINN